MKIESINAQRLLWQRLFN